MLHRLPVRLIALAFLALFNAPVVAASEQDDAMIVIAHRGASGERPEHTLAAYERGIDQGADYIEPDLVVTKDGVLVARHESEISGTTDVAQRAEFADRRVTKLVYGEEVTGWFAEDFTLAELRTLRARERLPELRDANTRFDGLYQVPTFAEIVALVNAKEVESGKLVGLYPELKHPTFLMEQGHDTVALLVAAIIELELDGRGLDGSGAPLIIQSFEVGALKRLAGLVDTKLVQLISSRHGPRDIPDMTSSDMVGPDGLAEIATYAHGIGADIRLLVSDDLGDTGLTRAAQDADLQVHAWTARKENMFLPDAFRRPGGPAAEGCDNKLYDLLMKLGVDGVFSDDPGRAVQFRDGAVVTGWCATE